MEVHHHRHHEPGHKKKLKDYLAEFLMLFLAVSAGFFAENIREHYVEHERAQDFSGSLLSDMKADTAALATAIAFSKTKIETVDHFFAMVEQPRQNWKDTTLYSHAGIAIKVGPYERASDTYEQMKASGSLRYLKHNLINQLDDYDVQGKRVEMREAIDLKYCYEILIPFLAGVLDKRTVYQIQEGKPVSFPLDFRKSDNETMSQWINYMAIVQSTRRTTMIEYEDMLSRAKKIITTIEKEYPQE